MGTFTVPQSPHYHRHIFLKNSPIYMGTFTVPPHYHWHTS